MAVSNGRREDEFRMELRALYDDYRKALLNIRCYEVYVGRLKTLRRSLDVLLVGTSCGALASWWAWRTAAGQRLWIGLAMVTAATALLRVALPVGRSVDRYQRLKEGYETLFEDLKGIVERVRVRQSLDLESVKLWSAAFKRMERGASKSGRGPHFSRRLLLRSEEEVDRHISMRGLWMPQDAARPHGSAPAEDEAVSECSREAHTGRKFS
jgi:hypothetical protein